MEPNENSTSQAPSPTEVSPEPKSNKPLIATTVITSVLALAGIGFGVYGMIDANNKSTEIANLNSEIANLNVQIENAHRDTTQNTDDVTSTSYYDNLLSYIKNMGEYKGFSSSYRRGTISIDNLANLIISRSGESYTVANNVVNFFIVNVGNGNSQNLYFINSDGVLNVIKDFDAIELENPTIEKMEEYKNIISVIEINESLHPTDGGWRGSGLTPHFIDIDGIVH